MKRFNQHWRAVALAAMMIGAAASTTDAMAEASKKNVMCVKTNTGQFFPVVRVSMMVVPDGASTFEIVLKDGQGEAGVESISFEKHEEEIDFSLYRTESDGTPYIDLSKPSWLITSTGKFFKTMNVQRMETKTGSTKFDIVTTTGTEADVESVYFVRNTEEGLQSGIDVPVVAAAQERLQLMSPVHHQLAISGCGDATVAEVYSLDGKMQTSAAVSGGNTTVQVAELPAGVYVVRVGQKALKFTKK